MAERPCILLKCAMFGKQNKNDSDKVRPKRFTFADHVAFCIQQDLSSEDMKPVCLTSGSHRKGFGTASPLLRAKWERWNAKLCVPKRHKNLDILDLLTCLLLL